MSNDPIETLTEQDIEDLEKMHAEDTAPPVRHTLLEIWRELFSNIDTERDARITPAVAQKIVSSWPQLDYKDVPSYYNTYYTLLQEMRQVVLDEIEKDPTALEVDGDADAVENRGHYINIIREWNILLLRRNNSWNVADKYAGVQLAAMVDAQNMVLGQTGLVAHLGEIGFEFTDEDREALAKDLDEAEAEL